MVTHGGIAPAGASGKAAAGEGGPTPAFSGARGGSRASQHARASGQPKAAGAKHDLLRQATSNAKKQKVRGRRHGRCFSERRCLCVVPGRHVRRSAARLRVCLLTCAWLHVRPLLQTVAGRLVDPDQEAREAVAAELQRWAQEEAQKRECAKRQALAYATGGWIGGGRTQSVRGAMHKALGWLAGRLPEGKQARAAHSVDRLAPLLCCRLASRQGGERCQALPGGAAAGGGQRGLPAARARHRARRGFCRQPPAAAEPCGYAGGAAVRGATWRCLSTTPAPAAPRMPLLLLRICGTAAARHLLRDRRRVPLRRTF
mgnify:CR=1 FL=1